LSNLGTLSNLVRPAFVFVQAIDPNLVVNPTPNFRYLQCCVALPFGFPPAGNND